jgi:ferrous iron transport protein A
MLEIDSQVLRSRPQHRPSPMPVPSTSLDTVAVGDSACVLDVEGDDPVAIRLLEMGLTPGVAVRVLGRAPFGDPLELELRGYRLSIRRAEAARVTVARS